MWTMSPRTRCPSSSTDSGSGPSEIGCSPPVSPASAWPAAVAAEQARGLLPPGVLGQRVLDEVRPTVEAIHRAVLAEIGLGVGARTIDVNVDLGAAGVVAGTVIDVHGATLVTATYSRLAAKHRIAAWVRLLAVSATGSERDPRAVSVGKGRGGGAGVARIPPMRPERAATHLATILDLYRRGMREPLPIYCNTSEALARKRNAPAEWVTDGGFDREDRDPAHVFVLGDRTPFAQLCRDGPRPDEAGPGGPPMSRRGSVATPVASGTSCSASRTEKGCDHTGAVRRLRAASVGHHAAGGQRRHRQDLHHRRRSTARYVAEGTPLERMLLVTFGRMATGELRARVRERLVTVDDGLLAASHGVPPSGRDEVLTLLAAVSPDELRTRRHRVATALADFDAATIATTHGFCQQVLDGIGVAGDVDRDGHVRRGPRRPRRRGRRRPLRAPFHPRGAAGRPVAARRPGHRPIGGPSAVGDDRAGGGHEPVGRHARPARPAPCAPMSSAANDSCASSPTTTCSSGSSRALRDPQAAARLRRQFDVVMIDEFQDTDPVQWDILRTAFGDGSTTLMLIGDPKQAIYAFRGADVHTYLDSRPPGRHRRDPGPQLAQRPGTRRGLRRVVRRPHARASGHRVPHRAGRRRPPATTTARRARTVRHCGYAWPTATTVGSSRRARAGPVRCPVGPRSPTTSPPTSSRCCPPAPSGSPAGPMEPSSVSSRWVLATSGCWSPRTATARSSVTRWSRSASRR